MTSFNLGHGEPYPYNRHFIRHATACLYILHSITDDAEHRPYNYSINCNNCWFCYIEVNFNLRDEIMRIPIQTLQGSHYVLNQEKYDRDVENCETTQDGFVDVACGLITNEQGEHLIVHHYQANRFVFPGGKVDKGETVEEALERELMEELGVKVIGHEKIGSIKEWMHGRKYRLVFFACEIDGVPVVQEADKHSDIDRVAIEEFDNELGFAFKVQNTIFSTIHDMQTAAIDLYFLMRFFRNDLVDNDILAEAPYHLPETIDVDAKYTQRFDLEEEAYFVVAEDQE